MSTGASDPARRLDGEVTRPVKIVMMGAGSSFTPRLMNDILKTPGLTRGEIAGNAVLVQVAERAMERVKAVRRGQREVAGLLVERYEVGLHIARQLELAVAQRVLRQLTQREVVAEAKGDLLEGLLDHAEDPSDRGQSAP